MHRNPPTLEETFAMFHSIETHLALDRRQLMSGAAVLGLAG